MGALKNDQYAKDIWGTAYDRIPKAAFAAIAYYLAEQCASAGGEGPQRFVEEAQALADNGIMTAAHSSTVLIEVRRLVKENWNV